MSDEITFSALSSTGGRISAVLSALVQEALYDATDLTASVLMVPWQSMGSDTLQITRDATPGAFTAATNETTWGGSNSAYTTSKFSLQVAPYRRVYQVSDLFDISGGPIDTAMVVNNLVEGVALTATDLICALFSSISTSKGSTGAALTVDTIYAAAAALNLAANSGPLYCVLHPKAMNDFIAALSAEGGAMQYQPSTAELLGSNPKPGFKGTWNNIEFWQSDSVGKINGDADYSCAMYTKGAFAMTMAPVSAIQSTVPSQNILLDAGSVLVESSRDARNGLSSLVAHMYPAVVEADDARAVEIVVGV